MKTMWDRRCRLSIGTKGGNVLLGLDLRSLRLGPSATFFKGARPGLNAALTLTRGGRLPIGRRLTTCPTWRASVFITIRGPQGSFVDLGLDGFELPAGFRPFALARQTPVALEVLADAFHPGIL